MILAVRVRLLTACDAGGDLRSFSSNSATVKRSVVQLRMKSRKRVATPVSYEDDGK
jgi:hypothetical protein